MLRRISTPATTANMGPGFDCLGMALSLYNEIGIEEISEGTEVINCESTKDLPREENLVYTTILDTFKKYSFEYKGFRLHMLKCDIPISRGLGSSASAIVLGIMAADYLMGNIMSTQEIIDFATEIEGHPDNVTPAVVGGMVTALNNDGSVVYSKVPVFNLFKFAVMVPDFKVGTSDARKVLPDTYSREDCVYNIARASMLINAMNFGEAHKLRVCFEDKIHQPYRGRLIDNMNLIFDKAKEEGSYGEFISGSGSTLIAVIHKDNDRFLKKMRQFFETLPGGWKINLFDIDTRGAKVL
jgi:homoserine kinase